MHNCIIKIRYRKVLNHSTMYHLRRFFVIQTFHFNNFLYFYRLKNDQLNFYYMFDNQSIITNKDYFPSMLPAEELAQLKFIPTFPEFVTWIEQKWADLPCLSDTVNTLTYKQTCDLIARKRALLNELGLQKGDKVAILDNITVDAVEMFLAVT